MTGATETVEFYQCTVSVWCLETQRQRFRTWHETRKAKEYDRSTIGVAECRLASIH